MKGSQVLQKFFYRTANKVILYREHFTFKVYIHSQYLLHLTKKILSLHSPFLFPSPQIIWHMIQTEHSCSTCLKTSSNLKVLGKLFLNGIKKSAFSSRWIKTKYLSFFSFKVYVNYQLAFVKNAYIYVCMYIYVCISFLNPQPIHSVRLKLGTYRAINTLLETTA